MAGKLRSILIFAIIVAFLTPIVFSDDVIPANKKQIEKWFQNNAKPGRPTLDPNLVLAEQRPKIITVSQDGKGNFRRTTDAIKSIPLNNNIRTVVVIYSGIYFEKIYVEQNFVTFYGKGTPTLVYNDTNESSQSSLHSASVHVQGQYFVAANIIFKNSAPRHPSGGTQQAVALRIGGDKAAFFNCKFLGLQDTLLDDNGKHFYKDCYIEGIVDFIWGSAKSIFLNTQLNVIQDQSSVVVAQFRHSPSVDAGFSFAHCTVTGTSCGNTHLGRALEPYSTVVFSYTQMSKVVNPQGWAVLREHLDYAKTVFFREYKNTGVLSGRVAFSKNLTDSESEVFLSLSYIEGSKWLLPPPRL